MVRMGAKRLQAGSPLTFQGNADDFAGQSSTSSSASSAARHTGRSTSRPAARCRAGKRAATTSLFTCLVCVKGGGGGEMFCLGLGIVSWHQCVMACWEGIGVYVVPEEVQAHNAS